MTRLPRPALEDCGDGALRSRSFGDIYFSPEDGLAESRYVFVDGNDLGRRLAAAEGPFVIAELGFGTGLNLLAAWAEADRVDAGPLQVWSCEGFPLLRAEFIRVQEAIARRWPELAPHAERLATLYPEPCAGTAQLRLDDGVTLTLAFGPVLDALHAADFRADAWFLDGFAPSRNPEMWSPEVMTEVARLSREGATAATFSVASGVRGALEAAGFAWDKAPGFGRKKHMLRARLDRPMEVPSKHPWFARPRPAGRGRVAIVGGGIAGAALAHSLSAQERPATVFGWGLRDRAASGNPAGLVMPRLDADQSPAARFYRDAFLFALRTYGELEKGVFDPCGGSLVMDEDRAGRLLGLHLWPEGFLEYRDGRIDIASAGVLHPRRAVRALIGDQETEDQAVSSLDRRDGDWFIRTVDGRWSGPFSAVILATGAVSDLWPSSPVTPSRGQIDIFEGPRPDRVLTDGSYIAPLCSRLVAGATYGRFDGGEVVPDAGDTEANRRAAEALLGEAPGPHHSARAALRATTPDRHPLAGPLYDEAMAMEAYRGLGTGRREDYPPAPYRHGLHALTGLGSRGLVTAPILAAHVVAQVTGGVSPLTSDIAGMVHPGRFLIRDIRRGKINP